MKKISVIAIIVVLAFSQIGYYFLLHGFQQEWKESMKEKILHEVDNKALDVISLDNQKDIFWEEEGKEFSFNGQMYDVVKTAVEKGKLLLYCINDDKEQQLVDNYNSVTKQNSSAGKKANKSDNSLPLYVYEDKTSDLSKDIVNTNRYQFYTSSLVKGIVDKNSPPPKV